MELRERIISRLKKIEIPGLLSCSIIGSFVLGKRLGNSEDIDVYIILDSIDAKKYRLIVDEFSMACSDLQTNDAMFFPEFRAGAFKPHYDNRKRKIQLHVLINTLDMLSGKFPMVSLDWKMNNLLISGKSVSGFLKADSFSREDLLNGRDGLKHFLEQLDSGKKTYMEWSIKDERIDRARKEDKLSSKEDWFELIQFLVIQGFVNFIRLEEPAFQKNELNILKKARTLPKEHLEFLRRILEKKRELKESGVLNYSLREARNKARYFIRYLIDQLEKDNK